MLIDKTCETCAKVFSVAPYRRDSARFCSGSCRATWVGSLPHNRQPRPRMLGNKLAAGSKPNATAFRPGMKPWNAGKVGIHLSPGSEFKPGRCSGTKAPVGTVRIRANKRDGIERAYIKTAEPNVWKLRARIVWEDANGPLPRGKIIHHRDRDALNDAIHNLECLTRAEHATEHQRDLHEVRWPVHADLSPRQTSLRFRQE